MVSIKVIDDQNDGEWEDVGRRKEVQGWKSRKDRLKKSDRKTFHRRFASRFVLLARDGPVEQ